MTIEVELRHAFPGFTLDAAFAAPDGITALFGRSGAGKTTIVNALAGLLQPDHGKARIGDTLILDTEARQALPAHRRQIGYVFQEGRLFPHLTVSQNLRFGRWFAPSGAVGPNLESIVALLGIDHLLDRRPGRLSGGEKQRVAIGRALLSAPRLLLMDEPLAALDDARKSEILPYLQRLWTETRIPILYVSHSVAEIAHLATTVVAIGEGRVLRAGPVEEVLSDPEAVPFIGVSEAGAVLSAVVVAHDAADGLSELSVSGGRLHLPRVDAPPGTRLRLRIHADDVIIATERPEGISALNVLEARVTTIRQGDGPGAAVGLVSGEDRLLARITRRSVAALDLAPGATCYAILKSTAVARGDIGAFEDPASKG